MSETPTPTHDYNEKPPRNCLLSLVVFAITLCLCATTITLSGLGGYQDEARQIRTEQASTQVAEVATQYALALVDQADGALDFAADRYEYIETQQPGYLDAATRLREVRLMLSATPTPSPTFTPTIEPTLEATATPTPPPTLETTPTTAGPNVADYFIDAQKLFNAGLYEDAIEYLDIVVQLDPQYRRAEVDQMLFTSLKEQATIYFRARNLDDGSNGYPGNQLARGVQLANRAIQMQATNPSLGDVSDLSYERFFVEGYITAEAYIAGGFNGDAVTILNELCELNCGWGYRGVTVQDLLNRAGG